MLTGSILIYLGFRAQMQELEVVQRESSRAVAGEINAYIDDLQRKLGYLARVRGLTDLSPEIQHDLLTGLTRHHSAYETVAILDHTGRVVSAISPYGPLTLENQAGSLLFSRAFKQQEDFVGPVEFDPATRLLAANIAVPIRNQQDEVDGVLLAKVNLKFLWFVVSQATVGETGYTYVHDERNFLVAQTGDFPETFALEDISDRNLPHDLPSGAVDALVPYRGLRGVEVLGAFAPIDSVGWHVVVELPTAEAYASVRNMLLVMGSALLITVVAAVGLGFVFSRQVVGPLQRLTAASAQISAGNLDVEVNIASRNELRILATTFNGMAAQLRELISGLERHVEERTAELRIANEQLQQEITERKRAEAIIKQMAYHDTLTGLPNRRLFSDRLNLALAHAHRNQQKLAVMLLDLDHFKEVNDTLGHSVGDQLLQAASKRLTSLLRKGDTVARMGGDEFLLLLPEIAGGEDAAKIAAKILEAFRKPYVFDGHELCITTSIGIALYPDDGEDEDKLIRNADITMYRAKEQGRDNCQRYTLTMKAKALE